jgi:membrane protein involved in colicin uptake
MSSSLSKNYVEEVMAVVSTLAIIAVGGCSSLNRNLGEEKGFGTASAKSAAPADPQSAVGLPGVIESASGSKTDASLTQAQYAPFGTNPELQQKFDNLQNRFNQRVDQTQAGMQAARNVANTQAQLQSQANQVRNQVIDAQKQASAQVQKAQTDAQKRLAEMQAQANQKVVVPVNQAAQQASEQLNQASDKVDESIEKAVRTVDQSKQKASTSVGRFLDSILPDTSSKKP